MCKVFIHSTDNSLLQTISARRGERLSELLARTGFLTTLPCGGRGQCKKCSVLVATEVNGTHDKSLQLACQTTIKQNIHVYVEKTEQAKPTINASLVPQTLQSPEKPVLALAAVDVGTTSIAAEVFYRTASKRIFSAGKASCPNPQAVFGADLISRLSAAQEGKEKELFELAWHSIFELIDSVLQQGKTAVPVKTILIAGNTPMCYLLTRTNTKCLTEPPFAASSLFGTNFLAEELHQRPFKAWVNPDTRIVLPLCLNALVGSDISCGLFYLQEHFRSAQVSKTASLFIDIGTNCEIALFYNNAVWVCSSPAGPAFEGAGLSCGMTNQSGAIEKVQLLEPQNLISCDTIDQAEPAGICGSGIVDAIAVLLEAGIIDSAGTFRQAANKSNRFTLAPGVFITQQDIRAIQLAKAAISAAITTLCHQAEVEPPYIQDVHLAGNFGKHLNIKNALTIGLFPPELATSATRFSLEGNTSLAGAAKLLLQETEKPPPYLSPDFSSPAFYTGTATIHNVNLAEDEFFKREYMESIDF